MLELACLDGCIVNPDRRASPIEENRRLSSEEVRSGATRLRSLPLQVNVELTGVCNVEPPCVFCSGKNFGTHYPPLDPAYLESYSHLLERCEHVNEDSFGEPLSHPGLVELAQRVTANGQVFSFVTNGLLLSRSKADKLAACGPRLGIHVSCNASTEDTFFKLTGKSLARVVENVRYYAQTYREQNGGAAPDLILTFLVMRINRGEVAGFLRLTRELGARALLAPLHDRPSVPLGRFGYDFVYEDEMLPYRDLQRVGEEATALADQLGIECALQWDASRDSAIRGFAEPGVATPCLIPWRFLYIQEHSHRAFACPYHLYPYGDLLAATVEEIWNGEAAQEMRRSLARGEVPRVCLDHSAGCPLVLEMRGRALGDVRDACDARDVDDHVTVGENDFHHLIAGWHALERVPDPIRWTSQASDFLIRTAGRKRLFVDAMTCRMAKPVCGRVEVGGRGLGGFRLRSGRWCLLSFRLPRSLAGPVVLGRILIDQTWIPAEEGLGGDTRRLGIAVRRIWVD
jgi:MoaA/NifB/PqqE/SkfB family radical SAM enzyme